MEFYGQFPKFLRSLVDDVEDSESLTDDDDATKKSLFYEYKYKYLRTVSDRYPMLVSLSVHH